MIIALIFFFFAAAFGILVNFWPIYPGHTVADVETMRKMRTDKWGDADEAARSVVAHIHIGTVESLRKGNGRKVRYVAAAQFCQILALVAVSIAVLVIVPKP